MGMFNDAWPRLVKVSQGQSNCKINIPIKLAREVGFNKTDYVIIKRVGEKKVEIKRYDSKEDYEEYVQGNISVSD